MCRRETSTSIDSEDGIALVATILVMTLLATLAATVVLSTMTEAAIAGSYREGQEAFYAAESAMAYVVSDLRASSDWRDVVSGKVPSAFVDGASIGRRMVGTTVIDFIRATADVNALRPSGTALYKPYAYGDVAELMTSSDARPGYVIVWVADRSIAGDDEMTLGLFAQAYGPTGGRRAVEEIVARTAGGTANPIRVTGWSEVP